MAEKLTCCTANERGPAIAVEIEPGQRRGKTALTRGQSIITSDVERFGLRLERAQPAARTLRSPERSLEKPRHGPNVQPLGP